MKMIVALGEILVEIMADQRGNGFRVPLALTGPYPSGAPAIFIDQVGRLGYPCGMIAAVGDDDFGALTVERLRADGVDVSAIEIHLDLPTGSAFVRYRDDGERDFIFNIRHSASSRITLTPQAHRLLASCRHLHIMGSSLFSAEVIGIAQDAVAIVHSAGGTVSFDPNVRKEMLAIPVMRDALTTMLRCTDLFMPSGSELTLLTAATFEQDAVAEILGLGVGAIVVKRGAAGASYDDGNVHVALPAYPATEIDPTGAGDCFSATFVTCRLQGRSIEDSLRYANAAGARAVGVRGPMEGASTFTQLDAFIAEADADGRLGEAGRKRFNEIES